MSSTTRTVQPLITPTTFSFSNLSFTYDGATKTATVTPSPSNATYTADLTKGPGVGNYTVSATANGSFSGSGSATLTIAPPPNSPPTISWASIPSTAYVNQWFTVQARGDDPDGNISTVYVWRDGQPFAFNGFPNGHTQYSDNNAAMSSVPGTITFMAQSSDSNGATSGYIYHTVTIVNRSPSTVTTINGVSANATVNFGQSVTLASTATDPDGNLTLADIWWDQGNGSYWTNTSINWNYPANATGWSGFSGNHAYLPAQTSSNSVSATFIGQAAQKNYVFLGTCSDAAGAWPDAQPTYIVTVNQAIPNQSGWTARTWTGTGTAPAGTFNVSFSNPYSGSVAAPTGAPAFAIVGVSGSSPYPTGGAVNAGTVFYPGTYTVRCSYPGDTNYTAQNWDVTFNVVNVAPTAAMSLKGISSGTTTAAIGETLAINVSGADADGNLRAVNLWVLTPSIGWRNIRADNSVAAGFTENATTDNAVNSATNVSSLGAVSRTFTLSLGSGIGTYSFVVRSIDASGVASVSQAVDVAVSKANQAGLTLTAAATQNYGAEQTLGCTGGSGSGAVSYAIVAQSASGVATLTGSTLTANAGVGWIDVQATKAADGDYSAITSNTVRVTLAKAPATVTLGNLNSTYDGTAKAATATTSPAGLAVTLTYNGSTTPPTNADSYAVVGTINDPNYTGSVSGTLTIHPQPVTITFSNLGFFYDGQMKAPTIILNPSNATTSITGTSYATIGGNYSFTVTANGNYTGSGSCNWTIGCCPATITLGNLNFVYDGTAKVPTYTTLPVPLSVAFTYNGQSLAPTDAGDYAVVATVNSPADANGQIYVGSTTGILKISKIDQATLTLHASATQTYNTSQMLTSTGGSGTGAVSYSIVGQSATGVATLSGANLTANTGTGWVDVQVTKAADTNYNVATSSTVRVNFGKASQAAFTLNATTPQTYGTAQTLTSTGGSGTGTVSYAVADHSATGVETLTGASLTANTGTGWADLTATKAADANYSAAFNTVRVNFAKANQATLTLNASTPQTYNTTQTLTSSGGNGTGILSYAIAARSAAGVETLSGANLTANTGTGWVDVTVTKATDANYNAATSSTVRVNFGLAGQAALTLNATTTQTYNTSQTLTNTGGSGTGAVSYAIAAQSAAGVATLSGAIFTANTGTGWVDLQVTKTADANYSAKVSSTVRVNFAQASQAVLTLGASATQTYNTSQTLTSAGGSGTGAINYTVTAHSAAGVETLTGASLTANTGTGWADVQVTKAADANYGAKASAAVRVNFAKADQTIAFANPGTQKALVAIPLTATAPGGTVTFSVASGPATVSGSTLTLTGYGTVNVTAAQSGNANYNAAASVGVSFLVKNTPPVARIRAATTSRIFGQTFEFFTDARDVDNDLVTVAGYVRGPGVYTPASPWGSSWTTVMSNTFAATGSQTGKATYLPPAVGSYNYCGSAVDAAGSASTNTALTTWADWNVWNTAGTNNSVGTFTVTPATPIGTFPAISVTGPYTLSAGDLTASFANPYSSVVAGPGGSIGFSILSASGTNASPTSGPISAGTVLQPGVYVVRASYSGDGNYTAATVDSQFIVSTTVAANDTDGNGLDDAWEQAYLGHIGADPNAVNANGVSTIDAYNSWQIPSLATANGFNNAVISIPVSMTVMGRGTGTVTLTDNGVAYVFKFVATAGNPWTMPTLDVSHPEYVGTYQHLCNYGSPDTIQVSASGVTDYFITAKLAPELHPQLTKALVEINGKVVDGIMPSEIVGNAFVLRARPGGQLPFGTLDSSHLQVNRLLELGMGGSRSGRTAGRILLSPTASAAVNIDKGDAMEGFVQSAVHFQAKVPAGYVDITRTHYRISIRYYFDGTPFSGGFKDFTGVTPDAAYYIDTIPSGITGAVPTPVRNSATSWNPAGSQRCIITRTVGGISHIFELESYSSIAPNQGGYSSPYQGPGGGYVTAYANYYSTIVRMWPWRLANAPRGGLIRAEFSHVDTVVQYPTGVPNTGYGTNELDMTSYLGATEASAVGDYEYQNSVPLDYAMLRAIPLTRGLGDDQYDLPHNTSVRAGPINGLNLSQDMTQYENGFGGGTLTEYLSGSADINGANNLAGQALIALGLPKSVRTSFGDNPVLSASDLISNYTYSQDPVDGSAVPTNVVTTQGTTQVGATSYLYTTGTFNSLPTLTITATQSTSPTISLTTTTFSYSRRTADVDLRGKTLSVTRPDGTKTSYAYQRGTLSGSSWTADANGADFLTAELSGKTGTTLTSYGTAPIDGVDLDPSRSSVSETITDQAGRVLREASYVYQSGGTFVLLNATYSTYDALGNLVLKADQPGANPTGRIFYQAGFNGFQKAWESDEQGITRTYHYDAYDRVDWMKRSAASASGIAIAETKTAYLYDALGRLQQETVSSEGEGDQLVTSYTYDTASRPKSNTTPGGLLTSISYDSPTQTTTTLPGGGIKIAVSYLDGRSKSVTGSAVPDSATSYAYDSSGNLKTTQTTAGQTGTQTADWAGRTISADAATSSGGTRTTSNTYNSLGQLVKQEVKSGGVSIALPHLYQYDAYGRLYREGMAIGAHDLPDPATDFGVKEYETAFQIGAPGDTANWYLYTGQKIWPYAGTNAGTFRYASQSYTQVGGLTSTIAAHSIALDFDRNRTETTSTVDRAHQTLTNATTTAGTNQTITQVSLDGLPVISTNAQGQTTIMTYDGLGRLESTNDPRIGMSSVLYYPNTTFVEYTVAPDFQITGYGYDAAGHVASQTNNNNKSAYFQYDPAGNLTYTWGDTTNPVHYEYNELGQKTKMHTYRTGTWTGAGLPGGFSAEGDVTTWNYQSATGLLNSKVDALTQTTSYQYDAMGRSTQRTDGRGWITNYSYTAAGQPWVTSYTDGITPSVTFAYDRAGRVQTVDDAAGRRSFAYYDGWSDATYDNDLLNKSARLKSETLPAYFGSHVLNYGYQYSVANRANGAQNSLTIDSGSLYAVGYGYDDVGRPQTVNYNALTPFTYTYVPNSNLVDTVAQSTTGYKRDYDYETTSNRLSTLKNQFGGISASTVEDRLTYDFIGQRDTEKIAGTAWMTTLGRGTEAGVHADYQYTDRSELEYSAKYQLTSDWGVGGFKATTDRTYNYDPIGNRTSDVIGGVAGSYAPNDLNQYTSAPTAGSMTYDGNGNLKADGTRLYDYDGENRLITVTQGGSVWHYEYDYLNRRIRKYGTGLPEQRFIYDGWNLIAETDGSGNLTRRYAWGLDISGTLQGAGGVGGLLLIQDGGNSYYPLYDASHNVIGLYNGIGAIDSAYEYDPFGRLQSSVGAYAVANPFRFSTKYTDNETSFTYYGVRYYSPLLGRFINRDPIQEAGGINLYGFCENDGVNRWDNLGMDAPAIPLSPIVVTPDQDAARQADRDREQTKTDYGNSLLDFNDLKNSLPKFDNKLGFTLQLSLGDAAAKSQLSTIGAAYNIARLRAKSAKQMRGFWRTILRGIVQGLSGPSREEMELRQQQQLVSFLGNIAYGATIGTAKSAKHHWDAGNEAYLKGDRTMAYLQTLVSFGDVASLGLFAEGAYKGIWSFAAAETAPGRVFWSGRQGANRAAAEAHAAATGQTTLEMTATGRALEAQGAGIDAWRAASADFARGAAGDVTAFAGKSAPGSVWRTVELPLLKQNPEVTRIIIKDAVNPSTTTIIYPR